MHVHMHMKMHMQTHMHVHMHVHTHMHMHMNVQMSVHHVHMHVHEHVHLRTGVDMPGQSRMRPQLTCSSCFLGRQGTLVITPTGPGAARRAVHTARPRRVRVRRTYSTGPPGAGCPGP